MFDLGPRLRRGTRASGLPSVFRCRTTSAVPDQGETSRGDRSKDGAGAPSIRGMLREATRFEVWRVLSNRSAALRVPGTRPASPTTIQTDCRGRFHALNDRIAQFLGEARLDEGGTDPSQQFHSAFRGGQQFVEHLFLCRVLSQTVWLPAAVIVAGAGDMQVQ